MALTCRACPSADLPSLRRHGLDVKRRYHAMRTRHSLILCDWAFSWLYFAPFASISFLGHKCSKKALAELLTSCVGSSEPRVLLPLVPIEGFRASSAKRRCGSERCLSRELGVTRLPLTPKPVHSPCATKKSPSCKLEISCGSLKPIDLIDLHNTDRPCGVLFSQEQSWPATKLGG